MNEYWEKIERWEYSSSFYTVEQWQSNDERGDFKGLASGIMTNDGMNGWNTYAVVPAQEEDYLSPSNGVMNGYRVFFKRLVPDHKLYIQTWSAPDEG